ncbi:LegC family aminotransferase [Apibacter raozihei]|uniref:LegC family aminotransferase n=1 Tax=Apibacter raozihei TaxID=2500547 RepID=UPI000FE306C2|nr:LegC family aminotransferase [Apibacter raozihei]
MFESFKYFIRKLYDSDQFIPLHQPVFFGNEKKYIIDCVDSTFVSSVGKYVDLFETKIKEYTGSNEAVACVNGTSALHLALIVAGVEKNDEVLTQALTFVAGVNAIKYVNADPVFIDIDKDTLGMSPLKLEDWLSKNTLFKNKVCYNKNSGKRIKACIPMHTFGHPVKIDDIYDICKFYNIELIEDAAESIGSFYKGKHTGTFAEIGVISFNGNKTITTGGGGILLLKNSALSKYAKHMSTQAKVYHQWNFEHDSIGYNYRLPSINAALGCAQMENLDKIVSYQRQLANKYKDFCKQNNINFVIEPNNSKSNYWLNAFILNNIKEKDDFLKFTNSAGIMTRSIWKPINQLDIYKNCQSGELINTLWAYERIVNVPSSIKI